MNHPRKVPEELRKQNEVINSNEIQTPRRKSVCAYALSELKRIFVLTWIFEYAQCQPLSNDTSAFSQNQRNHLLNLVAECS